MYVRSVPTVLRTYLVTADPTGSWLIPVGFPLGSLGATPLPCPTFGLPCVTTGSHSNPPHTTPPTAYTISSWAVTAHQSPPTTPAEFSLLITEHYCLLLLPPLLPLLLPLTNKVLLLLLPSYQLPLSVAFLPSMYLTPTIVGRFAKCGHAPLPRSERLPRLHPGGPVYMDLHGLTSTYID
jgi:hypothetical protein